MIVPLTAEEIDGHDLDSVVEELVTKHPASAETLINAWAGVRQFMREPGTRPEFCTASGAAMLLSKAMASCGERDLALEVARRIPDIHPLMGTVQNARLSMEDIRYLSTGIIRPLNGSLLSSGLSLLIDGGVLRRDRAYPLDFALVPVFRRLVDSAIRMMADTTPAGMILLRGWRSEIDDARNNALRDAVAFALDQRPGVRPHIVWTD